MKKKDKTTLTLHQKLNLPMNMFPDNVLLIFTDFVSHLVAVECTFYYLLFIYYYLFPMRSQYSSVYFCSFG